MYKLLSRKDQKLAHNASWVIGIIGYEVPLLFNPYIPISIKIITSPDTSFTVIRNLLRALQNSAFTEDQEGEVVNICIDFIKKPTMPVAIKANAITILQQICNRHTELAGEIAILIKERYEYERPAFQVRAKRFLEKFELHKQ